MKQIIAILKAKNAVELLSREPLVENHRLSNPRKAKKVKEK